MNFDVTCKIQQKTIAFSLYKNELDGFTACITCQWFDDRHIIHMIGCSFNLGVTAQTPLASGGLPGGWRGSFHVDNPNVMLSVQTATKILKKFEEGVTEK